MQTLRAVALVYGLLSLYYARFFIAVRQEGTTLVQIGLLLAALGVLMLPARFAPAAAGWFHWLLALAGLGLAMAVFAWADHDSHSASDTLNRAVPTLCLIFALVLRSGNQGVRIAWKH